MLKIPLNEATEAQLRTFAASLQIDIPLGAQRAHVVAALAPAWNQEYIFVEADEAPVQNGPAVQLAQHVKDFGPEFGPLCTFRIMTTEMPGGKHAAGPSVNGKTCKIDRGILVSTNYAFYEALKHATGSIVEQGPDRDGKPGELIVIDASNYPVTDFQGPSVADLAAWKAKYGARELGSHAAAA